MATRTPTGTSSCAIKVSALSGSAWFGAIDQIPTSESNSTTVSSNVSIAR